MARKTRAERPDFSKLNEVQITIRASELNLARLAALLLFAEYPFKATQDTEPTAPLPWEDPNDPRYQKPPELQIDYELVRRDITKELQRLLPIVGEGHLKELIRKHGAERLPLVPKENLLPLYEDLNRLNPKETK